MFDLYPGDLPTILSRASDYPEAIWRLWRYSAASQVFVLCGYRPLFDKIGYLLFRKPVSVCLPWMITGARFRLEADASAQTGSPPHAELGPATLKRIAIQSDGGTYRVLCEDVAFYQSTSRSKDNADVR